MGGALSQRWLQQLGAQAGWRLPVLRRHSCCALGCGDGTGPGLPAGVHLCDQQRQGNRPTSGSPMSGEQENAWCMQVHVQPHELQSPCMYEMLGACSQGSCMRHTRHNVYGQSGGL
jgi:hypothetical protein